MLSNEIKQNEREKSKQDRENSSAWEDCSQTVTLHLPIFIVTLHLPIFIQPVTLHLPIFSLTLHLHIFIVTLHLPIFIQSVTLHLPIFSLTLHLHIFIVTLHLPIFIQSVTLHLPIFILQYTQNSFIFKTKSFNKVSHRFILLCIRSLLEPRTFPGHESRPACSVHKLHCRKGSGNINLLVKTQYSQAQEILLRGKTAWQLCGKEIANHRCMCPQRNAKCGE